MLIKCLFLKLKLFNFVIKKNKKFLRFQKKKLCKENDLILINLVNVIVFSKILLKFKYYFNYLRVFNYQYLSIYVFEIVSYLFFKNRGIFIQFFDS